MPIDKVNISKDDGRGHFWISMIKSILRIVGCLSYFINKDLLFFVILFALAEGLGIIEEIVDKR